jgi:DNA-directed RNA polymerase subunit RPC12/RpoP
MKIYFKFACLYCGQHMKCEARLCGRQLRCPVCGHPIVIPLARERPATSQCTPAPDTWDTWLPTPKVQAPTRYRSRKASNPVLA